MRQRKLGMVTEHRMATLRSMVTSFLDHEKIETTEARAREVRRMAERLITLAKRGDLHARRQAMQVVTDEDVAKKLFDTLAARYAGREGGYTRLLRLGARRGDAAPLVSLELV
ncbi:MAG: 50S ribosomal protein L17 [bacterium]|nr:50S ribosomal protein L17 [bacterium]